MKYYSSEYPIPHSTQATIERLEDVFNTILARMGKEFMNQIYIDMPELFSQRNDHSRHVTHYKAELFVITREEAKLLYLIKQWRI